MYNESPPSNHTNSSLPESSNIFVAVRIRRLLDGELEYAPNPTLTAADQQSLILRDDIDFDDATSPNRRRRRSSLTAKLFTYDCVCDAGVSQESVFEQTALPLVDSVLDGVNACVFASGATGSGKTYTMVGDECEPGIMTRSLHELFNRIGSRDQVNVKCSFVEIYNEVIRDLLLECSSSPPLGTLDIRSEPATGFTYIHGVTEMSGIRDVSEIMELLRIGNNRRTTEPTAANQTSSRSHAILQVVVEQGLDGGEVVVSKLSLIDLAGSERAKDTQNRGIRFVEGGNINKSLLALGNCIKALSSGQKGAFVPYRDSKLTRLLKDSLGGNSRTVMIANVSPYLFNYTDTLNTLKFASRAKNIQVKIKRNSFFKNSNVEIQKYVSIIHQLEEVVEGLRVQLAERDASDSDASSSSSSGSTSDNEEWMIKNQLMETVSEQLGIRSQLARIDSEMQHNPTSETEKERADLIASLQINSDRSNLLQRSMNNLNRRRRSLSSGSSRRRLTPSADASGPSQSAQLDECCDIARRIIGDSGAGGSLQRQASLARNKSTHSLRSATPTLLSTTEKLAMLKSDLLLIERGMPQAGVSTARRRSVSTERPSLAPAPIIDLNRQPSAGKAADSWQPIQLTSRQPLHAVNEIPRLAFPAPLPVMLKPSSASPVLSRGPRSSSGVIYFN